MDVVELENVQEIYRLVPTEGKLLKPIAIKDSEKTKKLVRVSSKTTINNGKTQIGFSDGRSIISDEKLKIGDTCLIQIPEVKIIEIIKLEAGVKGLVIRGTNAGQIGNIESVEAGTFILPKRVILTLGERKIEIPAELIMPVGKGGPVIQLQE
jgi:small subunit ribosomal protein S4e